MEYRLKLGVKRYYVCVYERGCTFCDRNVLNLEILHYLLYSPFIGPVLSMFVNLIYYDSIFTLPDLFQCLLPEFTYILPPTGVKNNHKTFTQF